MDLNERALENAILELECLIELHQPLEPDYTRTYKRAIKHAANSINEILENYRGMK